VVARIRMRRVQRREATQGLPYEAGYRAHTARAEPLPYTLCHSDYRPSLSFPRRRKSTGARDNNPQALRASSFPKEPWRRALTKDRPYGAHIGLYTMDNKSGRHASRPYIHSSGLIVGAIISDRMSLAPASVAKLKASLLKGASRP
jgi:hypothetical protein